MFYKMACFVRIIKMIVNRPAFVTILGAAFLHLCVAQSPANVPVPIVGTNLGESANFSCNSDGTPIRRCLWSRESPSESGIGVTHIFLASNPANSSTPGYTYVGEGLVKGECGLAVENVKEEDIGQWKCELFADIGFYRGIVDLVIRRKPSPPELNPSKLGGIIRSYSDCNLPVTKINCSSDNGQPPPSFQWFLGNELINNCFCSPITTVKNGTSYTFQELAYKFTWRDNGKTLRCVMKHDLLETEDVTEAALHINIAFGPQPARSLIKRIGGLNGSSLYVPANVGLGKMLSATFSANPKPEHVEWMVDEQSVQEAENKENYVTHKLMDMGKGMYAANLSIISVTENDFNRSFVLRVANKHGSIKLDVKVLSVISEILVYNYLGNDSNLEIGRVVELEDWDKKDKRFQWRHKDGVHSKFSLNKTTGAITMKSETEPGRYNLEFQVVDTLNEKKHVSINVSVVVTHVPNEWITNHGSLRMQGWADKDFLQLQGSKNFVQVLKEKLATALNISEELVHIFGVVQRQAEPPITDIRYSIQGPKTYKPWVLNAFLLALIRGRYHRTLMFGIDECSESICGENCRNSLIVDRNSSIVSAGSTRLVGIKIETLAQCKSSGSNLLYNNCSNYECFNGGRCVEGKRGPTCKCPRKGYSPRCQITSKLFTNNYTAWYPPLEMRQENHLSLELTTKKTNQTLFYIVDASESKRTEMKLMMKMGQLSLHFQQASKQYGKLKLDLASPDLDEVADGAWHRIDVLIDFEKRKAKMILDLCRRAVINELDRDAINTSNCQVEARLPPDFALVRFTTPLVIGIQPFEAGPEWDGMEFSGSIRNLVFNGKIYDLATADYFKSTVAVEQGFSRSKSTCLKTDKLSRCSEHGTCVDTLPEPWCECNPGWMGLDCTTRTVSAAFKNQSYIRYSLNFVPDPFNTVIQLRFRTRQETGELFRVRNPDSTQYCILEIVDNTLRFRYNLITTAPEENVLELSFVSVNDDKWHVVKASRYGSVAMLELDGGEGWRYNETSFTFKGPQWMQVDMLEGVYASGGNETDVEISAGCYVGFLDDIRLNGNALPLPPALTQWGQATIWTNEDIPRPEGPSPPLIIKQPLNKELLFLVKQCEEQNDKPFKIECEAKGDPAPQYKWTKNGRDFSWHSDGDRITQKDGSGTLFFRSPKSEDAGQYQCFATNKWGTASTNTVFLRKAQLKSFRDNETTGLIAENGKPFKLSCNAPDGWPKPQLSWVLQNGHGHFQSLDSPRLTVDPEGTLWFSNITRDDIVSGYLYTCAAFSNATQETKLGNRRSLAISETAMIKIHKPVVQYVTKETSIVIKGSTVRLWCIIGGTPLPEITWSKDGGSLPPAGRLKYENYGKTLKIDNVGFEDEGIYKCGWKFNGTKTNDSVSMRIAIYSVPYFTVEPYLQYPLRGDTVEIRCEADGSPAPKLEWSHNGQPLPLQDESNSRRNVSRNRILIENVTKADTSNYGCNASNEYGYVYKDVFINVQPLPGDKEEDEENLPDNSTEMIIIISLAGALVAFIAIVILSLLLFRRHYRVVSMTDDEMQGFFKGDTSADAKDKAYKMPYDKTRYEISEESFSIDKDAVLGSGEFGRVCKGKITVNSQEIEAAVKMANPQKMTKTILSGLLSEIKVLAYVGKHVNITELLGANTSDIKVGKVYIFLELCPLGSLEKYLRRLRPVVTGQDKEVENIAGTEQASFVDSVEMKTLSVRQLDPSLSDDLYRWSQEICNGMSFLATKHVVHADLATRNILLSANKEAKICDFGLSRRMYNYASYVKSQQEPLPWKWMAPESLRIQEFNEKTDVWAFGVTLWEMYSLGDSPYQGLFWDINFATTLERGFRLGEPQFNEHDMYSIMKQCWTINPVWRPSFADLNLEIGKHGTNN